jgi:hypothetical protein
MQSIIITITTTTIIIIISISSLLASFQPSTSFHIGPYKYSYTIECDAIARQQLSQIKVYVEI